nr:hypothetical protein [uncultured Acetatifactor sp.]
MIHHLPNLASGKDIQGHNNEVILLFIKPKKKGIDKPHKVGFRDFESI